MGRLHVVDFLFKIIYNNNEKYVNVRLNVILIKQ